MRYSFYVRDQEGTCVPVRIRPARAEDFMKTVTDGWASNWTSMEIQRPSLEKYVVEELEGNNVIAFGAYEAQRMWLSVLISYAESEPGSHPGLVAKRSQRRYTEIGKVIVAYGVLLSLQKGFDGTVHFKAKTTELYEHYKRDFGAIDLPSEQYALIIFGEQGIELLENYKEDAS